jgi:peptide/nickel transport system ATP-binding protein
MDSDYLLEVQGLKTHFFTRRGVVPAVNDISFKVRKGGVTGLVGESGCGKSVTSLSIMGLISPPGKTVAGSIKFEGRDLLTRSYSEMCNLRGSDISMIFQEPMTSLNPVQTVGKQVGESLHLHTKMNHRQVSDAVVHMLDLVGIPEPASRLSSYPHQLSGGLRQRVMIAMALICEPKLLIADEPTTALDVTIQAQILELMLSLIRKSQTSVILITHDLGVVAEVCDEVNVMYAGKIVEATDVFSLFDNPKHPYTQGLLQSIPKITGEERKKKFQNIKGMVPSLLKLPQGCSFAPRCTQAMQVCSVKQPPLIELGEGHMVRCWKHSQEGARA